MYGMDSNTIVTLPLSPVPVGIRMLDGDVTDIVEAQSLSFRPQHIDIYLSSWGPVDDGATLEGPGPLTRVALQSGIKTVRERKRERKSLCVTEAARVCLCLCPTCGCVFTSRPYVFLLVDV